MFNPNRILWFCQSTQGNVFLDILISQRKKNQTYKKRLGSGFRSESLRLFSVEKMLPLKSGPASAVANRGVCLVLFHSRNLLDTGKIFGHIGYWKDISNSVVRKAKVSLLCIEEMPPLQSRPPIARHW